MIDAASLKAELARLDEQVAEQRYLQAEQEKLNAQLAELKQNQQRLTEARLLLLEAGKAARRQVKALLESVVTRALQAVYDETYRFEVDIQDDGKQAEIGFYVICGDPPVREEPTDAMGGGVVDVVSLALRIAFLELCQPKIGGPLILDEPGRHLDKERSPLLGQILTELAHEFGRQVILITHDQALAHSADRAYQVIHNGEASEVVQL